MTSNLTTPTTPSTSPSPVSLMAITPVAATMSLTTQPTAPGMKMIIVLSGTSIAGTIGLAGKDVFGNNQSETLTIPASGSGTYYSSNIYSLINPSGVTTTGLTSGSLVITGVFGWNRNWLPSINTLTQTIEWFTGSESLTLPFTDFSDYEFDFDVKKEFTLKCKGIAQDRLPIGNRAATPLTFSQVAALSQPVDRPNASWACSVFMDPITGTPGTTSFGSMLSGKLKFTQPTEGVHTLGNKQVLTQITRGKWDVSLDAKLIYTDVLQLEQFRQDNKQYVQLQFFGRSVGSNNVQTITFIIPFKFNKFEVTSTPSMKYPEADIAGIGEYDPGIGASYKVSWINSVNPPNYTS
jgi:hypothetical protein